MEVVRVTSSDLQRHTGRVLAMADAGSLVEVPRPGGRVLLIELKAPEADDGD
jgi:hypothetical protein